MVATVAKKLTGAGIGIGVASKFKEPPLVTVSAAAAGMIGAYAKTIIGGTILTEGVFTLAGVGEPLGAFVAAYLAVEIGGLVAGKTKVDILVTPITTITVGSVVGLSIGVPIAAFMTKVGELINWGAVQQPFWAGIIVSALMGYCPDASHQLGSHRCIPEFERYCRRSCSRRLCGEYGRLCRILLPGK